MLEKVHASTRTLIRRRQDLLAVKSTLSLTKKSVPELNDQPSYSNVYSHEKSSAFQELLLTQMYYMTKNFKTNFKLKPSYKFNIYKLMDYMFL